MQYAFFNLDGSEFAGIGGDRPLDEMVSNITATKGKARSEYAVFEITGPMPQKPWKATIDLSDPAAPVATNVVTDTVKLEEINKQVLSRYADEKALRYGATMVDPNSATNEPIADASASLDEIRQQQGKARAKMHWGKRHGSDGDSSTPGSKARNIAAQTLEESLADEVVAIQIDIEAGTVTTEAQVDARIEAINLTY